MSSSYFIPLCITVAFSALRFVDQTELEAQEAVPATDEQKPMSRTCALAKTLKQTLDVARERDCPVVMAFKRRRLQKLCHKGAPVSCVGVINFDGAEDKGKRLIAAWREAVNLPAAN